MAELGIRPNRLKAIGAWGAEKLGRLKLNGQLTGYSPLSRFLELESLYLGITGKRELWRALQRTLGNDLMGFDFDELGRRAERQAAEVEEHRLEAAQPALSRRFKPVARDQGKGQGPQSLGGCEVSGMSFGYWSRQVRRPVGGTSMEHAGGERCS